MINKYLIFNFFILNNLLILINSQIIINKYRILDSSSEIIIKISGTGKQKILNSEYKNTPSEVLINGCTTTLDKDYTISNLIKETNEVALKWKEESIITDCIGCLQN